MEKTHGSMALVDWIVAEIDEINASENILTFEEINQMNSIRNDQRKKEFLAVRHLKHLKFGEELILYGENGKPTLSNSEINIGISHSAHWALFAHAMIPFGCDIEEASDRINPLSDRFCSSEELELFPEEIGEIQLTQIWSCKEAMYKLLNIKGIHWKKQMRCIAISGSKLTFVAETGANDVLINCESIFVKNAILSIATYA